MRIWGMKEGEEDGIEIKLQIERKTETTRLRKMEIKKPRSI